MTRDEHLTWCKKRALAYVAIDDLRGAFASMCSDVLKHEETKVHASTNELGMMLLLGGHLATREQMTKWIEGYR